MSTAPTDERGLITPIRFDGDGLDLLDQRVLPRQVAWVRCSTSGEVAQAIAAMVVRGAPAIAVTAAYGMALAARRGEDLRAAAAVLLASRPTAVNLRWALERLASVPAEGLADAARAIHAEDAAINRALGDHGAAVLPSAPTVYTHCNTGALATGGWGTALGVIRSVHHGTAPSHRDAEARRIHVFVGETRPYLQGARLTAWECLQEGIDCTLVVDSAAAVVLPRCDAVLVGADRVAANGDTANKIGTLSLAILARHHGVPFFVCVPSSTLDPRCPDGDAIPVEERGAEEVLGHAGAHWAADVPVFNPAFDVTPASLVTGWITEHGLREPPFGEVAG
ncbi:MAG: S-methyl-5-thioribose-1-phosphate isomerase [Alphaproteobacteria bacterium]|nr:S-methyl-5-thioribose-1-phosphate isomerase [Alphaproteobacteria bacterium]